MRIKSDRVSLLKEQVLIPLEVCTERAKLMTESFLETEGESVIIRRAKAFAKILGEKTIYINNGELIVGNQTFKPRAAAVYPELVSDWLLEEIEQVEKRKQDRFKITTDNKKLLKEILFQWKGKTVYSKAWHLISEEAKRSILKVIHSEEARYEGVVPICVDNELILNKGLKYVKEEIKKRFLKLDPTNYDEFKKMPFYKATAIVLEAATNFAKRYADYAKQLAMQEENVNRKFDLQKISKVCEQVPENPARTFHEALQSVWIVHVMLLIEAGGFGISPGRIDQYLYPFYARDIEEGRITKEHAQELLECFWIKFAESTLLLNTESTRFWAGFPMSQNVTIGGQTKDGLDATNELTYMCLDAEADVRLFQPSLALRTHKGTPNDLLVSASRVIRIGTGKPKLFNDEIVIPAFLSKGFSLMDARDYVCVGCGDLGISGKSCTSAIGGHFNLAECLELALSDGVHRMTGERLGVRTGNAAKFHSFDHVLDAFKTQVEYFVKHHIELNNATSTAYPEVIPVPFQSVLVHDCLDKEMDLTIGGARYNEMQIHAVGMPDVADSLAAIKKLVFDEQVVTISELIEALDKDFEGKEELRQTLINRAPKYGNDDEYVDLLAREAAAIFGREVIKYCAPRGGRYEAGMSIVIANIGWGEVTGALPSGRKAGEPLADGGISPCLGVSRSGPTAVIKSAARLDYNLATGGVILNLRFQPNLLKNEEGIQKFVGLLRSFITLGGYHIQFNVVSNKTLKKAQLDPEKYRDLLIRVAGYSAYFVEQSKKVQENIMERTEFGVF